MQGPQHQARGVQHRGRPTVSTDAYGYNTDNDDDGDEHADGDDDHDDDEDDDDNDGDDTDLFCANQQPWRRSTAVQATEYGIEKGAETRQIRCSQHCTQHGGAKHRSDN